MVSGKCCPSFIFQCLSLLCAVSGHTWLVPSSYLASTPKGWKKSLFETCLRGFMLYWVLEFSAKSNSYCVVLGKMTAAFYSGPAHAAATSRPL